jgi:hypothetical protein
MYIQLWQAHSFSVALPAETRMPHDLLASIEVAVHEFGILLGQAGAIGEDALAYACRNKHHIAFSDVGQPPATSSYISLRGFVVYVLMGIYTPSPPAQHGCNHAAR